MENAILQTKKIASRTKSSSFFKPTIQKKLSVGSANDSFEVEADNVANRVMQMSEPSTPSFIQTGALVQKKCSTCEEEKKLQKKPLAETITPLIQRSSSESGGHAPSHVENQINSSRGGGSNMDNGTKNFMESRFGSDFSDVKIHTNSQAVQMSRELSAQAFTVGNDIYFNEGKYNPNSSNGKHLLAHELTHTLQQSGGIGKKIQKLSAADCSKDCSKKDGKQDKIDEPRLILYVDKEADFLTIPLKKEDGSKSWPVGHSWLKIINKNGDYWTYGFWPESGFDSSHPFSDVEGCVHHPDNSHTPSSQQEFKITDAEFIMAKTAAIDFCNSKPKYNLRKNQCTSFTNTILKAINKNPIGGYGLFWDTPNALSSWMDGSRKSVGIGYDFNSNSFQNQSVGTSIQGSYIHQFYSVLGNKIRFQWLNQASIGLTKHTPSYLSSGLQLEYKPQQIVYLPSVYIYGAATGGLISPNAGTNFTDGNRWGVGLSSGIGLNYNIQDALSVGFEYGIIKNIVNGDPVLQSLSLKIGINFQ